MSFTPTIRSQQETLTETPTPSRVQPRAYSVTAMPSELQKMRQDSEQEKPKQGQQQPWWQYYYQLYHYQLPAGRKPTVFGPFLLLQTLGEGEFGKVKFGIEIKTGKEVAIKLIRKENIDTSSRMTKVEREISVLRKLRHPNIVELYDVIETEKYIGIILQCATGGELFDYILAHRYLKEKDASRLFAQLMSGVHYMHQKHIVHRDLKLENLLLDKHRNVLITDFGFANQFSSPVDDLMSTSCGSPCYAAPELVMNQGVYVGPAVDIWSCGVILFAMLCGYLPYDDDPANPDSYNINLLYKYILNTPLTFPDYISKDACDLLHRMLVPDPEKRCTMKTVMEHPWLSAHRHLFDQPTQDPTPEEDQTVPSAIAEKEEQQPEIEAPPVPTPTSSKVLVETTPAPPPKTAPQTPPKTPKTKRPVSAHDKGSPASKSTRQDITTTTTNTPSSSPSILQAKFISSMQRRNASPSPNTSASTPYKKNHPTQRVSAGPPARPSSSGPRRKTLSLLVNSVTDNIAHRRRPLDSPSSPSVSEQTLSDKEKHRSAGKKLIDWFKKKPMSTVNSPPSHARATVSYTNRTSDPKLRTHHGAVDQEALTSRPPLQVFLEVKQTLNSMGLETKRDGGEYKLKCVRPKKIVPAIQPTRSSSILRRPDPPKEITTIYGESSVDPGDEVRFSIELCKIKNLPGLYIVDMRRMKGNVWSYKYLYHTLMDTLHLKDEGYHSTSPPHST
ncbi:kinase-like domain-containing protein [Sporodiniella umbellata]|nr:kinase-like domain-containing protein [Sporodiniella umbellata]